MRTSSASSRASARSSSRRVTGGRLAVGADDAEDGVAQDRLSGRHRREAGDLDDIARAAPGCCFGLDADAAGAVLDVQARCSMYRKRRRGREVADLDRPPGDARGDDARARGCGGSPRRRASSCRCCGSAAAAARTDRAPTPAPRCPGASGEERHAAQLLGLTEDRADVAAEPDAGVDETGRVLGRVVPERRADDAAFDRDARRRADGAADPTTATCAGRRRQSRRSRSRSGR